MSSLLQVSQMYPEHAGAVLCCAVQPMITTSSVSSGVASMFHNSLHALHLSQQMCANVLPYCWPVAMSAVRMAYNIWQHDIPCPVMRLVHPTYRQTQSFLICL